MTKTQNRFGISNFGHCDLPFDLAQGGELVEPFDICDLLFGISGISKPHAPYALNLEPNHQMEDVEVGKRL